MQKHRSELATVDVTIELVGLLNNHIFWYQFARQTEQRIDFKPALWSDTRKRQAIYAYDIYGKKPSVQNKR